MPDKVKYLKYEVVAVDFDGTLCQSAFPGIGPPDNDAIKIINDHYDRGGIIIIHTCRQIGYNIYNDMYWWLQDNGVKYHLINENHPSRTAMYGGCDSRKIGADMYIDDRNPGGIDWKLVKEELETYVDGTV